MNIMSCDIVEGDSNSSDRSDDKTFINKLLVEMKSQFNKTECKKEGSPSDNSIAQENSRGSSHSEQVSNDFPFPSEEDSEAASNGNLDEASNCSQDALESKPRLVLTFRKPTATKTKSKMNDDSNVSHGSLRNKSNSEETGLKRSARRRSKDCNESVLQSAIARKEKSYNESNKPQRLSKQLKPTQKILDNIAKAALEKTRNDKSRKLGEKAKMNDDCSNDAYSKSEDSIITSSSEENDEKGLGKRTLKEYDFRNSKKQKSFGRDLSTDQDSDGNSSIEREEKKGDASLTPSRRSQRISLRRAKGDDTEDSEETILEPSTAEQNSVFPAEPECSSVGAQLIASRLCLCTQKTHLYVSTENHEVVYCSAIDNVNNKLIGCGRVVDDDELPMLRPSNRVPFIALCTVHYNRMLRHNCCPTCGIFCTQGRFTECEAKHQYHRECQISVGDVECCPHCGTSTPSYDVFITLHSTKKPVILPTRQFHNSSAKMTFKTAENLKVDFPEHKSIIPNDLLGLSVNMDMSDGNVYDTSHVLEAIEKENLERLSLVLGCDSMDLNAPLDECDGGTVLHYASQKGNLAAVHLLAISGAELNLLDKEQNSPLILSISGFKNDITRYLIKAGASITLKGTDGMTAIHIAAKHGNLEACEFLLDASNCIRDYINVGDDGGWTPLVWACEHGHKDVAKFFLQKGADPHVRDVEHNIALHWAAFSDSGDITEMLLNSGCDVNTVNVHGEAPLHIGARQDNYNAVLMLLVRGANVSLVNKLGESPLDCAPNSGNCYSAIALNVHFSDALGSNSRKILLSNDVSRGREANPVQCVNLVDEATVPTDFTYVSKNCFTSDIHVDYKIVTMQRCTCEDRCLSSGCDCTNNSLRCWYDHDGKLSLDFDYLDPPLIFECNEACACNSITCSNRVVQRGITQRFQVFRTHSKGWGLRTLRDIHRGTFVCEYVGEVISDAEAELRDDDSYIFDLNNKTTLGTDDCNTYCVDAKHYGNFARFVNHSCEPNIFPVKVFIDHQDLRFPRIALFAGREIAANEELSFDYGDKFWSVKYKSFACDCGSSGCKYSERSVARVLDGCNGDAEDADVT